MSDLEDHLTLVRFQVLTAASMKMSVFWDVAPCSVVEIYLRFIFHEGPLQTCFGALPASYPMYTGGSFLRSKSAEPEADHSLMNIEMGLKEERKTYLILILFSNSRS
jgi:hypothetical protein